MPTGWRDIEIDEILNYAEANTGQMNRYDRIMRQYEVDALNNVRGGLFDLKRSVHIASDKLVAQLEKSEAALMEANKKQGRLQTVTVILTVVIALATISYTVVTWQSVQVQREANEIQRQQVPSPN